MAVWPQVACEDTVMYTVHQYLLKAADKAMTPELENLSAADMLLAPRRDSFRMIWRFQHLLKPPEQEKAQKLASLIRCQHLSQYWLLASIVLPFDGAAVLGLASTDLRKQLGKLLMLRCAKPGLVLQPSNLQEWLPGAPASWGLGARLSKPVSSVSFTWVLQVSKLKETALRCVAEQRAVRLTSLPDVSPPLGGIAFEGRVRCVAEDGGCKVGVFVGAANIPLDGFHSFSYTVAAAGVNKSFHTPAAIKADTIVGFSDFFGIGVMASGWDEVAWSGKGLPASGDLPFTITVSKLARML
jgi:hypothetical protein